MAVCRQQDLYRILKAYTIYRPDEGYCQAQAPVAAVLLMHMPAEVGGRLRRPTDLWGLTQSQPVLISTSSSRWSFNRMAYTLCMHLLSHQILLLKVIMF